jgi:hypothetical protein
MLRQELIDTVTEHAVSGKYTGRALKRLLGILLLNRTYDIYYLHQNLQWRDGVCVFLQKGYCKVTEDLLKYNQFHHGDLVSAREWLSSWIMESLEGAAFLPKWLASQNLGLTEEEFCLDEYAPKLKQTRLNWLGHMIDVLVTGEGFYYNAPKACTHGKGLACTTCYDHTVSNHYKAIEPPRLLT